ncbi:alpha/beta fold hydrolase [Kitasatospora sp. NPDC057015]|uniref:alpha/beta fold hydrolase n=1 Tax=Kitasatospora sp. NPDC057015 TaxID=3346001 RepID=UPI0036391438
MTPTTPTPTTPAPAAPARRPGPGLDAEPAGAGTGRTALVLHGGGGPRTVDGLARHLAGTMRALTPTHPGWDGTARSAAVRTVADLADAYLGLLADDDVHGAVVVGSSIGGWIALEAALRDADGRIGALVLVNSVGVLVEGEPIRDVSALDPRGIAEHAFHDPGRFAVDPASLTRAQVAVQQANAATLRDLAGDPYMHDPGLLARLGALRVPTLVLWGAADRIVTPHYGRRLAAAIPDARFVLLAEAGHLPQIERPDATFDAIDAFLRTAGRS